MDPGAAFIGLMHPSMAVHASTERPRAMMAMEPRDLLSIPPSPHAYAHTDSGGGEASSSGDHDGDSSDNKKRRRSTTRKRSADTLVKNTRGDPHLAEGIPKVIKVPQHVLHPSNSLDEDKTGDGDDSTTGLAALVCKRARQHVLAQVKAWANQVGFLVHLKGTAEGNAFLISCHRYGKTNERNPARCGCQWVVRYVYDTESYTAYIRSFPHHDHNHPVGKEHSVGRAPHQAPSQRHHHPHQQQPQSQTQQPHHQHQHHRQLAHIQPNLDDPHEGRAAMPSVGATAGNIPVTSAELGFYQHDPTQVHAQFDGNSKAALANAAAMRKRRRGQWSEEDGDTTPDSPTVRPAGHPMNGNKSQEVQMENAWQKAKNWSYNSDWHRKMLVAVLERLPVLVNDIHVRQLLQDPHLFGVPEHLTPRPFPPQAFAPQPGEFLTAPHFDPAHAYAGAAASRAPDHFEYASQVPRGERGLPANFAEAYSDPRFGGARFRPAPRMWAASQPPEIIGSQVMPLRTLETYPEATWGRMSFVPQHHLHAQPVARVHTPSDAPTPTTRPSSAHEQASGSRNSYSEV